MRSRYESVVEHRSPVTLLTLEGDRHLRALAWAHIHRLNPKIARQLLRKVRARQTQLEEAA